MAPLPKKKCAKARQGERRSHLRKITANLQTCPQCHSPKLSHVVCPSCGTYAGREVIKIKSPKKKE
ncbi:MAG: 50S ribosomal protein L32 [Dehalococcoidia bacterium]|nr:50S ribosomal protein L32 [Dehalococcoidia bacterium]